MRFCILLSAVPALSTLFLEGLTIMSFGDSLHLSACLSQLIDHDVAGVALFEMSNAWQHVALGIVYFGLQVHLAGVFVLLFWYLEHLSTLPQRFAF